MYKIYHFIIQVRKALAMGVFSLYKIVRGSVEEQFNDNGIQFLIGHELPKGYQIGSSCRRYSPYFKKWGLKVPMTASEFFSKTSGIESDAYLTRNLAFNYIYPYLVRYNFCPAYADKNIESRVLCIDKLRQKIDIQVPEPIVYNMNGIFFNADDEEISREQAIKDVLNYNNDMIIKPSAGSYGGSGVAKICRDNSSEESIKTLFSNYQNDWVIQKIVVQHPVLASFNESSVNTMRIVTYRRPNKERKVLFSVIRFGSKGEIKDNVCAGGGFCVLNLDGTLRDRKIYVYKSIEQKTLLETVPNKIPYFEKCVKAALLLHGQMPHFDIMGWDFTITPDGHPVLIEYNIRPGYGLEYGTGPYLSKEDLDEIMPRIAKHKKGFTVKPFVKFNDKKGFNSNWTI